MLDGYAGRIVWVDLTNRRWAVEELDDEVAARFLGGKGLGAYYIYTRQRAGVDPLSPDNLLMFVTGPLTGTLAPTSAKSAVVTRSPLTGTFLDTYASGSFAPELKYAGYDALIVTGAAEQPTYLFIDDRGISFHDARHLWGLGNSRTVKEIRGELSCDDVKVISIGPAGENLVRYAGIFCDRRAHARGGAGAVMGSKRLKAVAVKGMSGIRIADPKGFAQAVGACLKKISSHPMVRNGGSFTQVGTTMAVPLTNQAGVLPTRNWREGQFDGAEKISPSNFFNQNWVRRVSCFGCPIGCSRISAANFRGQKAITEGPEYENIYALGTLLGNSDPDAILLGEALCDEYGMDCISLGGAIAFAMECYENGILTPRDLDGLELNFGNSASAIALIHKIARKEGIGAVLAEGVKIASQTIGKGTDRFAIHIKGMELPAYDPRGMKGQALNYAVSDRGGCHLRGNTLRTELGFKQAASNRLDYEEKGPMVKELQLGCVIADCAVTCLFANMAMETDDYPPLFGTATGLAMDKAELLTIAERVWHLTRLFNVREGFSRRDDSLPPRLLLDPLPAGGSQGQVVEMRGFERMIDEYYEMMGWDLKTGAPRLEKLAEFGLEGLVSVRIPF